MKYILSAFLLSIQIIFSLTISVHALDEKTILIHEIQTGGFNDIFQEDGRREFVELYNISDMPVNASGLKLQYFSATRLDVFDPYAVPTRELGSIDGYIEATGYVLFSYESFITNADVYFGQGSTATSGLLARSGGHVRIVQEGKILDVVAWGTAKSPENKALTEIAPNKSYQRKNVDATVIDTDNNFNDFMLLDQPTPMGGSIIEPEKDIEPELDVEPEVEIVPTVTICNGLIISELMPNPDGADSGKEFIELHNPTLDTIYLDDCTMRIGDQSSGYRFAAGIALAPGEYKAFYDNLTGLILPNAAGGSVNLIGTSTEYLVSYPPNMAANHSWSLIDNSWHDTNRPSPNAPNLLAEPEAKVLAQSSSESVSCGEGRYRNPETNRCRNIPAVAVLAECAPGQARNPETNRCRTVQGLAASLIPCREGQERNPETNRCRNISSVQTTQCQSGYERNPETNRCRKARAVLAASPSVGDIDSDSSGRLNSVFLVLMTGVVLTYGVYEYKRDIVNTIERFKLRHAVKHAVK